MQDRTFMEIGVRVEPENMVTGETGHIASTYLMFVCPGEDRRPVPVPPLILENEENVRRNRQASKRRTLRCHERRAESAVQDGN